MYLAKLRYIYVAIQLDYENEIRTERDAKIEWYH